MKLQVWSISNSSSDIIPSLVEPQMVDYCFTYCNGGFVIACDIDRIENAGVRDLSELWKTLHA
jgi:hypothetical protein